jgi:hypothetical protein
MRRGSVFQMEFELFQPGNALMIYPNVIMYVSWGWPKAKSRLNQLCIVLFESFAQCHHCIPFS